MRIFVLTFSLLCLAAVNAASAASTEADFKSALASAEAAEQDAGKLKNQWTTTEKVLAEAKKAAASGNFDAAINAAKQAKTLAKASIAQAKEQQNAWRAAVIR